MIHRNKYSGKPFNLSNSDEKWVRNTLAAMTEAEKIMQLFCLIAYSSDEEYLTHLAKNLKIGGIMCRMMPKDELLQTTEIIQREADIPMLIAANLESGGNGVVCEGTHIGSEMQIAAAHDRSFAEKLGKVCAEQAGAGGVNWSFAPIADIDMNFRNPITNTRTFGSDPEKVASLSEAYIREVQKNGMAACAKHFPGDGVDERDQHLLPSINSLSCEEWDTTYGMIYRRCIDAGVKTVMIGHILHPEYSRRLAPGIADKDILPASLSKEIVTGLLREKLGFNGLVITDSTTMAGFAAVMKREDAVPMAIAAGCDMFLFTKNLEEDIAFMKAGVEKGIITPERLDEAVGRILALKASLGLHKKDYKKEAEANRKNIDRALENTKFKRWERDCADRAITLVKSEKGVLPISPKKFPRVLVYGIESEMGTMGFGANGGKADEFIAALQKEGFEATKFVPSSGFEGMLASVSSITEKYDAIIYIVNLATKSNQTTVRIEWCEPMGANVPVLCHTLPTIMISLENPYHLLDAPRVQTYINTYGSSDAIMEALMDKLMGRSQFVGVSPVDAFCGKWDTHL